MTTYPYSEEQRRAREEALADIAPLCPDCGTPNGMIPCIREDFHVPYKGQWWRGTEFWCKAGTDRVYLTCWTCRGRNTPAPTEYERITDLQAWLEEDNCDQERPNT